MPLCKLCGSDRKLIKAHIIPQSFFLANSDDFSGRLITNVVGRHPQKVPIGIHDDSIVCLDCEERFARCDAYATEIFLKSWNFESAQDGRGQHSAYVLRTYDYVLLKKFFITVLWRAAVSKQPVFSKVDLGPREVILRNAILKGEVGDVNFFGVVLQAFDIQEVGILDPHPERFGQLRFFRFYFGRIIAYIKVDSQPFDSPFDSIALSPERPLVLLKKSFFQSKERVVMAKLAIADQERQRRGK